MRMGMPLSLVVRTMSSKSPMDWAYPRPAHHVFGSAEFDQPASYFTVAAPDCLHYPADGNAVSLEPIGVHVHLVLLSKPPMWRNLGNAGNGFQVVSQVPVLVSAHIRQAVLSGFVHQGILEDPAQARGVRSHFRLHALREARQDRGKIFLRARPCPVDIRAVFEDDVDIGVAEIGEAANGFNPGSPEHRRDDRVGHLVFDDVRASVPARVNDHLGVAEVGDGIQGHVFIDHQPATQAAATRAKTMNLLFTEKSTMRLIIFYLNPLYFLI